MEKLSFQDYRSRISIIDVAKSIGYSDKTTWAKEKKSSANPCLQNTNGDQIIISHPRNLSKQLYFNPQDTSDKGDLITFVKRKMNLDVKGVNDYLSTFLNTKPLIQNAKLQQDATGNTDTINKEFKAYYFEFSDLSNESRLYLTGRGIKDETLTSPAFQGFFKSVKLPLFRNGKFVSHSMETYLSVQYREELYGQITGVDYRNDSLQKHGISSKKSTSVAISNIPKKIKDLFIAESGIDAISHYQYSQPGNDVLYIITGGNLTLGQLLAIDKIKSQINSPDGITTNLLFDNDVAGSVYDLKFIAHFINKSSDEDLIGIEQTKDSVTLEINTEQLPVRLCEQLLSIGSRPNYTVSTEIGNIKISSVKEYLPLQDLSTSLINLFAIENVLKIQKSPVKKDWNDAIVFNPLEHNNDRILFHGTGYDLSNTNLSSKSINRGVGGNAFTLGNGIYLTDHLPAATLFSHLSLKKRLFFEGKDFEEAGIGNLYQVPVSKKARILDASKLLDPEEVRNILLNGETKYTDQQLSNFEFVLSVIANKCETNINPYQHITTQLGYDGLMIQEPTWRSWDYYPKHLNVNPADFLEPPKTLVMYNDDLVKTPVTLSTSTTEKQIMQNISNLVASFIETIEARKNDEINKQLLYGTDENKKNTLAKKGNVITFKKPFFWKGEPFSQIGVEKLETRKTGEVVLIGFARDSPLYKNIDQLIKAVDWIKMEGYHNDNYHKLIKAPMSFSLPEIAKDMHDFFGSKLSREEANIYINGLIDRFGSKLSKGTKDLLTDLSDTTSNTLENALKAVKTQLGVKSSHYDVYQKQAMLKTEPLPQETIPNDFNNQDAKPGIFSQLKNETMSQTNAGEQTQKTQSERLEGIMKSLGLKDVWDQLSQKFQTWADGNEEGRKSFSFENKTFRRTGYADPSRNIATDMIADIALNFNKNDKGVFFNSYTVELKNSIINGIKPEKRQAVKDTFEISLKKDESANNLSIKKALNLLDGRSVCIGENNWIKRNGNEVIEYKFDLAKAIKENKHVDFSKTSVDHMESALESLKKGDYALISCEIDQKPVHVFLTADAQYKKVEANDNTLYRHLSEAEKAQIQENMNHKQDQVQGAKQHP